MFIITINFYKIENSTSSKGNGSFLRNVTLVMTNSRKLIYKDGEDHSSYCRWKIMRRLLIISTRSQRLPIKEIINNNRSYLLSNHMVISNVTKPPIFMAWFNGMIRYELIFSFVCAFSNKHKVFLSVSLFV